MQAMSPIPATLMTQSGPRYVTRGRLQEDVDIQDLARAAQSLARLLDGASPSRGISGDARASSSPSHCTLSWFAETSEAIAASPAIGERAALGLLADVTWAQDTAPRRSPVDQPRTPSAIPDEVRTSLPPPPCGLCPSLLAAVSLHDDTVSASAQSSASPPSTKKRKAAATSTSKPSKVVRTFELRRAADGSWNQPRGRPPHDRNGETMLWHRTRGVWLSAGTGEMK